MAERRSEPPTPLAPHEGLYTDLYELTMAQGYLDDGRAEREACFDYFFRSNPFEGGHVVFAGLDTALDLLESFDFDEEALSYLDDLGFEASFLDYLRDFEFTADVAAPREGEVVFPLEPVVRVQGDLIETQLVETMLLNVLNFESLIATKASRMRRSAGDRKLIDFGLRRAQGFGAIQASRAAVIGGFDATSNVWTARRQGLEATGTQAHSWIQSFDSELEAFRAYARTFPEQTILLVDTYDTLESGVPNAIRVARELEQQGHRLKGIRLDSGDLAYLAKRSREMLDEAGFDDVKIAVSNQLDEHVIRSLLDQEAPIDVFGVGTQLVTAYDCPALDGVYKLSWFDGEPRVKLSENPVKINLPGRKQVHRLLDDEGRFYGDAVARADESSIEHIYDPAHPRTKHVEVAGYDAEPLLETVVEDGDVAVDRRSVETCRDYARTRLERLPEGHRRFENPHVYKVGLSESLLELRDEVVERTRRRAGL
jgi:nicotinate phosphoribosyltransferase